MDVHEFWSFIESARSDDRPFTEALAERLAARSAEQILEFQERFDALDGAVCRWDVWAAAYLIGSGCSDDSFLDFRAGLIALGRVWYERATSSPDSLADHPDVRAGVGKYGEGAVFSEKAGTAACDAFERRTGGDVDDFYEAWDQYRASRGIQESPADMGEDFDFSDPLQIGRRLPRLAALYLAERIN
ncbi:DUF4240 domain-containing protein [Streptomyces sp. NPDC019645]|uniref:DUF4240 domain-containing protein n=1 Tax=Streptomyces sp. NPDC019645 TaxID=3154786 RepID=UPI0033E14A8A